MIQYGSLEYLWQRSLRDHGLRDALVNGGQEPMARLEMVAFATQPPWPRHCTFKMIHKVHAFGLGLYTAVVYYIHML